MQAWRGMPLTVGSGWSEGGGGGEGAEHEQRGDEVAEADCHGDATVGAPACGRATPERHRPRYAPRHGAAAIPTDAALLCLDLARAPHRATDTNDQCAGYARSTPTPRCKELLESGRGTGFCYSFGLSRCRRCGKGGNSGPAVKGSRNTKQSLPLPLCFVDASILGPFVRLAS
jgi:hypothetical protein